MPTLCLPHYDTNKGLLLPFPNYRDLHTEHLWMLTFPLSLFSKFVLSGEVALGKVSHQKQGKVRLLLGNFISLSWWRPGVTMSLFALETVSWQTGPY